MNSYSCFALPVRLLVSLIACVVQGGACLAQTSSAQPVQAGHGMVASASGLASQAGVEILKRGGNAVDAACATAFALAVTYPVAGNLGGGGFMLIRLADGRAVAIDYRETAPLAATSGMYLDKTGHIIPNASLIGYRASGIPGTVAGLELAQRKYGKLKWQEVIEPARRLAAEGFPVSAAMASGLRGEKSLGQFPESRRVFLKQGQFYQAGETFRQPELAATLARLQQYGAKDFYEGHTAELIAKAMQANNGLITRADLKNYKAVEREPLRGTYRGCEVLTMPPPSSGGIALLEMLNILETHDLAKWGHDAPETNHLLIEAMRRAFADRAEFLGDPDFVHVPARALIAKPYAAEVARTIDPERATPSADIKHGQPRRLRVAANNALFGCRCGRQRGFQYVYAQHGVWQRRDSGGRGFPAQRRNGRFHQQARCSQRLRPDSGRGKRHCGW